MKSLGGVHQSSLRDNWSTPTPLFHALDMIYKFKLDACAEPWSAKTSRYYTAEQDGLRRDWESWTFCNPPYGNVFAWYAKAYSEALLGNSSVLLTFARTDTRAFHDIALKASDIIFIKGRLRFIDPETRMPSGPAPAPSMLVVFDADRLGDCRFSTMSSKPL